MRAGSSAWMIYTGCICLASFCSNSVAITTGIYIYIYHSKNRLVVSTAEWLPWFHGLLVTTP